MADLATHAGPVFDAIFQHVENPPPTPVADNADVFVERIATHLVHPLNIYTAYPDVTVNEIKALAAAAEVSGTGVLNPFLVVLPIKSRLAFIEVQLLLRARGRGTTQDLDSVGTPHFAQFVPLEDNQIGFFTVYDGSFDKYTQHRTAAQWEALIVLVGVLRLPAKRRDGGWPAHTVHKAGSLENH